MADHIPMDALERRKRASEEAAIWWVRLHSESLAKPERQEFVDWLRESALHVAEMLRLASLHDALQRFQSWADINTDGPENDGPDDEDTNVVTLAPSNNPGVTGEITKR